MSRLLEQDMKDFGLDPLPRHLGIVLVLCWRAGAFSRAVRYLDDLGVRRRMKRAPLRRAVDAGRRASDLPDIFVTLPASSSPLERSDLRRYWQTPRGS